MGKGEGREGVRERERELFCSGIFHCSETALKRDGVEHANRPNVVVSEQIGFGNRWAWIEHAQLQKLVCCVLTPHPPPSTPHLALKRPAGNARRWLRSVGTVSATLSLVAETDGWHKSRWYYHLLGGATGKTKTRRRRWRRWRRWRRKLFEMNI